MLAKVDNAQEQSNKTSSIDDCDQIFVKALEGFEIQISEDQEWTKQTYEVPLITDCYGLQPLDYAYGIYEHVRIKKGFEKDLENEKEKAASFNF